MEPPSEPNGVQLMRDGPSSCAQSTQEVDLSWERRGMALAALSLYLVVAIVLCILPYGGPEIMRNCKFEKSVVRDCVDLLIFMHDCRGATVGVDLLIATIG